MEPAEIACVVLGGIVGVVAFYTYWANIQIRFLKSELEAQNAFYASKIIELAQLIHATAKAASDGLKATQEILNNEQR